MVMLRVWVCEGIVVMRVAFPAVEPTWLSNRVSVRFYAIVGSDVLQCMVSGEALITHFGAKDYSEHEFLRAFREHRAEIETVAEQKIVSEGFNRGDEVILRMGDFPNKSTPTTTTTPPPGYRHILSRVSPEIMQDTSLLSGVKAANAILDEDFKHEGMSISAEWDLVPTQPRIPLAKLQLTDTGTNVKAEGLFTGAELAKLPTARFSILRLWDDLLRERGRKLMKDYEEYASAGSTGN